MSLKDIPSFCSQARAKARKSSPSVFNDTVYFGDESGAFHALDAATGEERWVVETGGGIISAIIYADLDVVGVVGHDVSEVPGEGHEGIGAAWEPHHLSTRSAEEEEESCCGAALGILAVPVLVDLHEASLVIAPQACEDRIL